MKHLLNNISEEEKNRIREQHTGGMKIAIDNFRRLVETKSGDVKPFINEANMETCEQCGNELTEGGECMECGTMYEEEMMEQQRLLLPDNLKINIRKLNGDTFFTIELDNKKVKADGDIVNVGGKDIDKDTEITVKYDCQKDKYRMFYGNGNNFDGMDITGMISDKAKEALKNIKTYCSGASAAL